MQFPSELLQAIIFFDINLFFLKHIFSYPEKYITVKFNKWFINN